MIAPIEVTGTVVGVEQLKARFILRRDRARGIVTTHIRRATISLQNRIKFGYLSGQALNRRRGRLINSINERVTESGDTITGSVGTKVPYGRFWELGFHGIQQVKDHTRGLANVRAHIRQVNVAARPFLKPGLQAERANIRREMEAATHEIAKL